MRRAALPIALAAAACLGAAPSRGATEAAWPAGSDSARFTRERLRPGVRGAEAPIRIWKSTRREYVVEFRRYFVRATRLTQAVGESLSVTCKVTAADSVWREASRVDLTVAEQFGHFEALCGDYLLVDAGCCPGPRGLIVYDLSRKKSILSEMCLDWPAAPTLRDGRWLTYMEDLGDFENDLPGVKCPEAAKWRRDQMGVGYEEKVVFDLRSLQKTRTGVITCSPRQ